MNRAERRRQEKQRNKQAQAKPPAGGADAGPDLGNVLQLGVGHHQAGRLDEAEKAYRQILEVQPDHPDANHLLGLIGFQTGHFEGAVPLIAKAIQHAPGNINYYNSLGAIYGDMGRLDEAVECLNRALEIDPNHADTHYNLGNALKAKGRLDEAAASYEKTLAAKPDFAEAHNNLGAIHKQLNQIDEAITCFNRAIEIKPDLVAAYNGLGDALLKGKGRKDEALAVFERALEANPDNMAARHMVASLKGETTETAPGDYVRNLFDGYALGFDKHLAENLEYRIPVQMRHAVDRLTGAPSSSASSISAAAPAWWRKISRISPPKSKVSTCRRRCWNKPGRRTCTPPSPWSTFSNSLNTAIPRRPGMIWSSPPMC